MKIMQKKVCIIVVFILLFNFIMSSFSICFAGIPGTISKNIKIPNDGRTKKEFFLSKETGLNGGKNSIKVNTEASRSF
ncbi:MAG: hypothetical protein IKI57_04430 [Clostridia bacterium]|nr:hypothetical protein [Clostridia bacterium]